MESSSEWRFQSLLVFIVALVTLILTGSFLPAIGYSIQLSPTPSGNSSANSKAVMLTFGDTLKSQFTNAKPILDKYGFKGSFFITCLWVGSDKARMTWQDILALQMDGQNIESKTMTHRRMTNLSPNDLNYEVAGSKKCLADHGINATIFATTHGNEWNNATVINAIANYYNFAVNGFAPLMFLHCDGYKQSSQHDCRTYFDNGTLTFANRYSIREWSHNNIDKAYSYNNTKIFQRFVQEVNSQNRFNKENGTINAVPVIGYHDIVNNKTRDSTDVNLFVQEMKYLHDNGFRVLTLNQLGYDTNRNVIYINNMPSS